MMSATFAVIHTVVNNLYVLQHNTRDISQYKGYLTANMMHVDH